MRAKWLGVAIAAMMTCGWAGEAEAFSLDVIQYSFATYGDGAVTLKIDGHIVDYSLNYRYSYYDGYVSESETAEITGSGFLTGIRYVQGSDPRTRQLDLLGEFLVHNAKIDYHYNYHNYFYGTDKIIDRTTTADITASFNFFTYYSENQPFIFGEIDTPSMPIIISGYPIPTYVAPIGKLDLSTVPLPASAPLFGAALLVLGFAGSGARRKAITLSEGCTTSKS